MFVINEFIHGQYYFDDFIGYIVLFALFVLFKIFKTPEDKQTDIFCYAFMIVVCAIGCLVLYSVLSGVYQSLIVK